MIIYYVTRRNQNTILDKICILKRILYCILYILYIILLMIYLVSILERTYFYLYSFNKLALIVYGITYCLFFMLKFRKIVKLLYFSKYIIFVFIIKLIKMFSLTSKHCFLYHLEWYYIFYTLYLKVKDLHNIIYTLISNNNLRSFGDE